MLNVDLLFGYIKFLDVRHEIVLFMVAIWGPDGVITNSIMNIVYVFNTKLGLIVLGLAAKFLMLNNVVLFHNILFHRTKTCLTVFFPVLFVYIVFFWLTTNNVLLATYIIILKGALNSSLLLLFIYFRRKGGIRGSGIKIRISAPIVSVSVLYSAAMDSIYEYHQTRVFDSVYFLANVPNTRNYLFESDVNKKLYGGLFNFSVAHFSICSTVTLMLVMWISFVFVRYEKMVGYSSLARFEKIQKYYDMHYSLPNLLMAIRAKKIVISFVSNDWDLLRLAFIDGDIEENLDAAWKLGYYWDPVAGINNCNDCRRAMGAMRRYTQMFREDELQRILRHLGALGCYHNDRWVYVNDDKRRFHWIWTQSMFCTNHKYAGHHYEKVSIIELIPSKFLFKKSVSPKNAIGAQERLDAKIKKMKEEKIRLAEEERLKKLEEERLKKLEEEEERLRELEEEKERKLEEEKKKGK